MNTQAFSLLLGIAILGSFSALYLFSPSELEAHGLKVKDLQGLYNHLTPEELHDRLKMFKAWTGEFSKQYSKAEAAQRFQAWNWNYEFVQEHNAKNLSSTVEMNLFADLTSEEFSALHLGLNAEGHNPNENVEHLDESIIEASVDWRTKGAVTTVKNQGSCGACYAFASVAGLESIYQIRKNVLQNLSNQQIAACTYAYGNNGCNGGLMAWSYNYTLSFGIQTAASYLWNAADVANCRYKSSAVVFRNTGWKNIAINDYKQLQAAVTRQPVPVGVQASRPVFQLYKSGIISADCGTAIDHAILAVGYSENSYWITKNSWGTNWGEKGYVRIALGDQENKKGTCAINGLATYPVY